MSVPAVRAAMSSSQELLKRGCDVVCAIAGLMLFMPLFAVMTLAIRLAFAGTVLCRERYYDLNDETFDLLSFRCSSADAKGSQSRPAMDTDMPWLGHAMRQSGLDKLPHLINLLRGDVSLVGPRCATAPRGAVFRSQVPWHRLRNVRPGLVSWALVRNGDERDAGAFADDCYYLANRSLIFDLKILVRALFSEHGYY